jgi:hypothetical protein
MLSARTYVPILVVAGAAEAVPGNCIAGLPDVHTVTVRYGNPARSSELETRRVLPTRVLEVLAPCGRDTVQPHIFDGRATYVRYAALSDCQAKQQTWLTTSVRSHRILQASICRPRTRDTTMPSYLHGMSTSPTLGGRSLRRRELWQRLDRAVQIAKIGDICTRATVTIAAARSRDCDEGRPHHRASVKERYSQRGDASNTCAKTTLWANYYSYLPATKH